MQQPSILLVEDDAFQRKAAEAYLANHDLKVTAVENGAQMRRQISRARFSAVGTILSNGGTSAFR